MFAAFHFPDMIAQATKNMLTLLFICVKTKPVNLIEGTLGGFSIKSSEFLRFKSDLRNKGLYLQIFSVGRN